MRWLPVLIIVAFAVYLLAANHHALAAEWIGLLGGNK